MNRTIHSIQRWDRGWATALVWGLGLLLLGAPTAARAASAIERLEKGIYLEETKGDLVEAAALYQQIVEDPHASRSLVAQAQLRLGLCALKQGNKPRAISALEQLTEEFPDKDQLLSMVEQNMPRLLDDMIRQIEQNYIQEIDRTELMETALRAMVGKLDVPGILRPHDLEYLSTNALAEMNVQLEQKLAGIGVVLKVPDGEGSVVVAQAPLPGSPALQGGLKEGDHIVSVDGKELPQGDLKQVLDLLRGPVGTPVSLGVWRAGSPDLLHFSLVRNTIQLPSLQGDFRKPDQTWEFMLDDVLKIGYLHLRYVGKQSAEEMRHALEELRTRGVRALVLDLRNNPGGMLDVAVSIADLFVESGRIVTVRSRQQETAYDAQPAGTFTGFPMAVLVNGKTASAAEIIAACLQDHGRAVVVGERTFGQGIVRRVIPLKNDLGALKLPVAAYYRPSGQNMNRYPTSKDADVWGVSPKEAFAVEDLAEGPGEDVVLARGLEFVKSQLSRLR